jgi:hypothetical protein
MIGVKTLGNAGKSSTTLAPSLVSLSWVSYMPRMADFTAWGVG